MLNAFIGEYNLNALVAREGFDHRVVRPRIGVYVPFVDTPDSYLFECWKGDFSGDFSLLVGSDADSRYVELEKVFGEDNFRSIELGDKVIEWFDMVARARIIPDDLSRLVR